MKKALLVVSFGTSYHDTREKNIAACERDLAASCPDRTLFRAFTSGMIIRKLQQRDGIHIDTPLQALQKLAEQGYQDVAIQSCTLSTATSTGRSFAKCRACARAFSV